MATPAIWFPQVIAASTYKMRFTVNFGGGAATYSGYLTADSGWSDPGPAGAGGTFLGQVVTDIEAATSGGSSFATDGGTAAVTLNSSGYVNIELSGLGNSTDVTIHWTTDSETQAAATLLGFDPTADSTGNTGDSGDLDDIDFTATRRMKGFWVPSGPYEFGAETPVTQAVTMVEAAGGQAKFVRWNTHVERPLRFTFLTAGQTWAASATGTDTNADLETYWTGSGLGYVRFYDDLTDYTQVTQSYVSPESARRFDPERFSPGLARYSFEMLLRSYTA